MQEMCTIWPIFWVKWLNKHESIHTNKQDESPDSDDNKPSRFARRTFPCDPIAPVRSARDRQKCSDCDDKCPDCRSKVSRVKANCLEVAIRPRGDLVDDQPTAGKEASKTLHPVYQSTSWTLITDTSDEQIYKPKRSFWKTGLSPSEPTRRAGVVEMILNRSIPKDAEERGRRQYRQTGKAEKTLRRVS